MTSPELTYLVLIAILTGVLWVPVVIGYVSADGGFPKNKDYVTLPERTLPDWVTRANRAHMNAVENLTPFAAIVLVASVLDYSTETTQLLAAVFCWSRLAHAVVFIFGVSWMRLRPVTFTTANVAMVVYGVLVLKHLL